MRFSFILAGILFFSSCGNAQNQAKVAKEKYEVQKSEEEWRNELSEEEFEVLIKKGTERPFTGDLLENKETGVYTCAACNNPLFSSNTKFKSGSGWPSFYDIIDQGKVKLIKDTSFGMIREEVVCGKCGGHLGHIFDDGPKPTGLRYCINSVALDFEPQK